MRRREVEQGNREEDKKRKIFVFGREGGGALGEGEGDSL